jgi:hypothetical protein
VNGLPKCSEDIAFELSYFINVGEFVVVGADVPVPPLGIGNVFASQRDLLS